VIDSGDCLSVGDARAARSVRNGSEIYAAFWQYAQAVPIFGGVIEQDFA
jgi:hypothetical protein